MNDPSGLIVIDKPTGLTSHDVVSRLRRKLKTKRVGHAGTLDPDASGVLVLCVGDATRLLEYLTADDKAYTGEIVFGIGTDTDDADGTVITQKSAAEITDEDVARILPEFRGEIEQVPPKYSAVHVDGRRAYELAREGKHFELPARTVEITRLEMGTLQHEQEIAFAQFEVECTKGTYIRSLCRDIGGALQLPAHLRGLRRTKSGSITIQSAVRLADFEDSERPFDYLHSPLPALAHLGTSQLDETTLKRVVNGQAIFLNDVDQDGTILLIYQGSLAAIGEAKVQGDRSEVRPRKVFWKKA